MTANVKNIILQEGDRIQFLDKKYKVVQRKDYSYMLPQLGFGLSRWNKINNQKNNYNNS